ncbi:MAG: ammonium transporter [Microbacteriaceae bacterium]|nr:ammonium transporter [Microbacteriaceae bacterium]
MADPVLVFASGFCILACVPGLVLLTGGRFARISRDLTLTAILLASTAVVSIWLGWMLPGFALLVGAFTLGLSAGFGSLMDAQGLNFPNRILPELVLCILLIAPLTALVFGGTGTWLYREFGALDFAGAVPLAVGPAGAFAVLIRETKARTASSGGRLLLGSTLVAFAGLSLGIGIELQIDEVTPEILRNYTVTLCAAAIAAAGIQRIKRGRNSLEGLACGMLSGMAAGLAACAYLEIIPAAILGLLAGGLSEVARRRTGAAQRLAIPLAVGGLVGLIHLGIFAEETGFVYSGQLSQLLSQLGIAGIAAAWSLAISFALIRLPIARAKIPIGEKR